MVFLCKGDTCRHFTNREIRSFLAGSSLYCTSDLLNVALVCNAEMEKRADGADASVLFFLLGCANFLAVYAQIR